MNVIEKVKQVLSNFSGISELHIDFTGSTPESFSLSSVGDMLLKTDILGNQKRQHSFLFYAVFSSINDFERLSNSSALLNLTLWLENQKNIKIDNGKITKIFAENGMLYEIPDENKIIGYRYQMQIFAEYELKKERKNEINKL
ncbi:MAG: hypothetical protein K2K91_04350 [Ruminococcus sp.]|nr:hypothetical protein [Ruminococcus sp.]